MKIQSYRDLDVWKKSIQLVKYCYLLTEKLPKSETYGLASQMRRAAISIPANIAEGRSRQSTREYLRFVDIAYGSLAELETHAIVAAELQLLSSQEVEKLLEQSAEIGRMLNGLVNSLQQKLIPDPRPLAPAPL